MKIIASGDHHWSERNRFDECQRVHNWIAELVERERPDLFISAGDIYDRSSTLGERDYVSDWLSRIAEVCHVLMVRGNHDALGDLKPFGKLSPRITVEEGAVVHYIAGAAVACLAWPRREALRTLTGDAGSQEVDQIGHDALTHILRGMGDQLAEHDGPRIVLGHLQCDGAKTSTGQELVGGAVTVGLADLALARPDLVVMGHIHLPQEWSIDGCPVIYTGSPFHQNYGEDEEKSVALIEFDGHDVDVTRVETPCRRMVKLEATWEEGAFPPDTMTHWADVQNADVRFRYRVRGDERQAAGAAAETLQSDWLEAGAATVKLDPETIVETRARAPEVAAAIKLEDKVQAYWAHVGWDPGERLPSLLTKLAALQLRAGGKQTATAGMSRLERLRIRGIGPFVEETELDLTAISGRLVAIKGGNGSGKSTLVGCYPAALFREHPTYGNLAKLAAARDAFVEATILNGQRYTLRQTVDSQTGKGESLVLDAAGEPVLDSTKLTDFDAWAPDHLPNPDVFYAGVFTGQGSGGVAAMKRAGRVGVLLRAIGCEYLEQLAEGGRKSATATGNEAATLQARLSDEVKRTATVDQVEAALVSARESAGLAEADLAQDRQALAEAEAEAQAATEAQHAYDLARTARAQIETELQRVRSELDDAEKRIANNERILKEGASIRVAIDRDRELAEDLPRLRDAVAEARRRVDLVESEAREHERAERDANAAGIRARQRAQDASKRLRDRDRIAAAIADLPRLREAGDASDFAFRQAGEAETAVREQRLTGAEERIQGLRDGLTDIAGHLNGGIDEAQQIASEALGADDAAVKAAEELPGRVQAAHAATLAAAESHRVATDALRAAERLADLAPTLAAAEVDLAAAEAESEALTTTSIAERQAAEDARERVDLYRKTLGLAIEAERDAVAERESLAPTLAKSGNLDGAPARLEILNPQAETARAELARLEAELRATPEPPSPPRAPALAPLRSRVEESESLARRAASAVAVAEKAIETAREAEARRVDLKEQIAAKNADLADWNRLADTLGRGGLQAIEVDAAGPVLTDLCNVLLHECHGPRFTMKVETQRPSADGKKTLEVCEITVLDTERGREAPIDEFSGGEKVLLNECFALALSVHACERAGVKQPDLFRDESGAALDVDNVPVYVSMLRRAAERIDAAHVVYINHNPEAWALADTVVEVRDGSIHVVE